MQSPTIGVQANARMAAPSPAQRSASYANRTRSDGESTSRIGSVSMLHTRLHVRFLGYSGSLIPIE